MAHRTAHVPHLGRWRDARRTNSNRQLLKPVRGERTSGAQSRGKVRPIREAIVTPDCPPGDDHVCPRARKIERVVESPLGPPAQIHASHGPRSVGSCFGPERDRQVSTLAKSGAAVDHVVKLQTARRARDGDATPERTNTPARSPEARTLQWKVHGKDAGAQRANKVRRRGGNGRCARCALPLPSVTLYDAATRNRPRLADEQETSSQGRDDK